MTDDFDLSALTPEEREIAEASLRAVIQAGRVFTDQDQVPPTNGGDSRE